MFLTWLITTGMALTTPWFGGTILVGGTVQQVDFLKMLRSLPEDAA